MRSSGTSALRNRKVGEVAKSSEEKRCLELLEDFARRQGQHADDAVADREKVLAGRRVEPVMERKADGGVGPPVRVDYPNGADGGVHLADE
jgi:hypothetical protein